MRQSTDSDRRDENFCPSSRSERYASSYMCYIPVSDLFLTSLPPYTPAKHSITPVYGLLATLSFENMLTGWSSKKRLLIGLLLLPVYTLELPYNEVKEIRSNVPFGVPLFLRKPMVIALTTVCKAYPAVDEHGKPLRRTARLGRY
ncbi:hypothetical protein MRB53_041747 [Persea americana]|nr:hypothetical protein MRB53_041747 [Persea americana]